MNPLTKKQKEILNVFNLKEDDLRAYISKPIAIT
jgi:hypothetical protein